MQFNINNSAYQKLPTNVSVTAAYDGLNRDAAVQAIDGFDTRQNQLRSTDGARVFTYDQENRLKSSTKAGATVNLTYDPLGRLNSTQVGSTTTTFLYEGDRLIGEYNGSSLLRRYVHGAGTDEPLVWYEGSGTLKDIAEHGLGSPVSVGPYIPSH